MDEDLTLTLMDVESLSSLAVMEGPGPNNDGHEEPRPGPDPGVEQLSSEEHQKIHQNLISNPTVMSKGGMILTVSHNTIHMQNLAKLDVKIT